MIKPTVGRVVWFHTGNEQPYSNIQGRPIAGGGQPLAAIVTYVHSDTMVNLAVFDANGASQGVASVPLMQEGEAVPQNMMYCEWMPYQIGQAKKHA